MSGARIRIALLRGINVGGRHSLPMKSLTAILEALGFEDVRTYIQSGNVVMGGGPADGGASAISNAIEEGFGFRPRVLVLEASDFLRAIERCPYQTDDGKALHFWFTEGEATTPDLERLESLRSASESFELIDRVCYVYAPDGVGRSKMAAEVERCLGVPTTARNWNTVRKIASMVESLCPPGTTSATSPSSMTWNRSASTTAC